MKIINFILTSYKIKPVKSRFFFVQNFTISIDTYFFINLKFKTMKKAAEAAKAIKNELKQAYPGIIFSVKSDNFAGGNSVQISYNDGPRSSEVQKITDKYEYGHFNGMIDLYEYTNERSDIPQAKYVSVSRHMSKETESILKNEIGSNEVDQNFVWREFCQRDFFTIELAKKAGQTRAEISKDLQKMNEDLKLEIKTEFNYSICDPARLIHRF